ncbi:DUF3093 domain-containing protein [Brevibacterium otitidis]|uniref:DUF3093 domain-containing protein n=1 Tax=Brevibacterium otitidis TaxID=53364 RepID=A0ABV5X762_9MICO
MPATTQTSQTVRYRERLWPPFSWWLVAAFLSAMTAAIVFPVWVWGALIIPVVVFILVALWLRSASAVVIVTDTEFIAGPAHIDRSFIAEAQACDEKQSFAERGPLLDALAFLMLRPWEKRLVKVILDDPEDPTPYWLVSSKNPQALAGALNSRG